MILVIILGGIMNRIRGGTLTDIAWRYGWLQKPNEVPFVKDFNALVYATIFSIALGFENNWQSILGFAILYGSMKLGGSFGWGGYLTAMIDKEIDHNRDDVKFLDKWFRGNDEPVLSGWAALSIRGAMWTVSLWLGFFLVKLFGFNISSSYNFIPLVGLAMGTIYLALIETCERLTFRGNGWQWGEIIFGAYLWGFIYYLV